MKALLMFLFMIANAAASDITFAVIINDHYLMRGQKPVFFTLEYSENNSSYPKGSIAKKMSELLSKRLNMTFINEPALSFANKKVGDDEALSKYLTYTLFLSAEALRETEGYTFRPRS